MSHPTSAPLVLAPGLSREYLLHHLVCPTERRDDGSILGVFVARKEGELDSEGVDRLLSEFRSLEVTSS